MNSISRQGASVHAAASLKLGTTTPQAAEASQLVTCTPGNQKQAVAAVAAVGVAAAVTGVTPQHHPSYGCTVCGC